MTVKYDIPNCDDCDPRSRGIFNELNPAQMKEVNTNKGCHFHKAGQIIFYEGDQPVGLYCISKGKVKIYKTGDGGKEHIVRMAKEGDVCGYRALVSGEVYSASASVLEDAVVCFIPKSVVYELLRKDTNFSMRIINMLSHDVGVAEQHLFHMAQKPVRERLAETLLMLRDFYGVEEDGATLKGSITREDIANIVGTATESVIRLLSEFKQDNVIELHRRKIKIIDYHALIKAAHVFD